MLVFFSVSDRKQKLHKKVSKSLVFIIVEPACTSKIYESRIWFALQLDFKSRYLMQ